jgi:hypothetical protein
MQSKWHIRFSKDIMDLYGHPKMVYHNPPWIPLDGEFQADGKTYGIFRAHRRGVWSQAAFSTPEERDRAIEIINSSVSEVIAEAE